MGDEEMEAVHLITFKFEGSRIGFSVLESQSNIITMGILEDDRHYSQFKTLISQYIPQEVVIIADETPTSIQKILKSSFLQPQISF